MPAEKKGILDIKALKGLIKLLVGLFVVIKVLDIFFSYAISPFITGFVMQYLIFKKLKSVVTLEPKYTTLKARVVVKGSPHVIGKHIFDCFSGAGSNQIDYFQITEPVELFVDKDIHQVKTEELFDIPTSSLVKQLVPGPKKAIVSTYWASESQVTPGGKEL